MKLFKKEKICKGSYTRNVVKFLGMKFSYGKELNITAILNSVVDITKCPKATGKLRKLQEADTKLLELFHYICKKHNIQYAIAWGNLLGAVRHKGFIPWDDDMDVWVSIDDYERTINAVQDELKNSDFEFYGVDKSRLGDTTFRISHKDIPGINLDIFYLFPSKYKVENRGLLEKTWKDINKKYKKEYSKIKKNENKENLSLLRKTYDNEYKKQIEYCSLFDAKSILTSPFIGFKQFDVNDFYPLKTIDFEGFQFNAPNNPDRILTSCYGNYMSFPKQFFQHNDMFSQFDDNKMDDVICKIDELINKITKKEV